MRRTTILAFLVSFLAALLLPARFTRGGPGETGRAWDGVLPSPGPTGDDDWFVCRVRDAVTLEPIAGARWIRTPEWIAPWRLRHDAPIGVAVTDADGIAFLPTTPNQWKDDCHWLVVADGYGFAYEYGEQPPAEVRLAPQARLTGRVVNAMGLAMPGCVVEALGGCSHGTAAARAVTDADGAFTLTGLDPDLPGQLWVEGPGIAADLLPLDGPDTLGHGRVLLAMEPGVRYEGRVVDLLGRPIPGTVVRVHNEQRGPTALAGADGRFVLRSAEPDSALMVYEPADLTEGETTLGVYDAHPAGMPTPLTIVVGPLGVAEREKTATLRVALRDAAGDPVGGLPFAVVSTTDGRGPSGVTAEEGDDAGLAVGEAVEDVVAAPLHVVPTDPFARETFDTTFVPDPTQPVEIRTRTQPRLRVVGEVPDHAVLDLAVIDASTIVFGPDDEPWLPALGPAALCVKVVGRPPFFFEVGPVQDGVRTVEVALPALRTIVLPPGAQRAYLADGPFMAHAIPWEYSGLLRTDATGPLTVHWYDADRCFWEAPVVLPAVAGARVVVEAGGARQAPPAPVVRALGPDAVEVKRRQVAPGEEVVFERDGWQTLRAVGRPGTRTDVSWGPCTLVLIVRDEDGPVDALALVGREVHAAPEGSLVLRGLPAGPLRVVVGRRDRVGGGLELDLTLAPGDNRAPTVVVPLP